MYSSSRARRCSCVQGGIWYSSKCSFREGQCPSPTFSSALLFLRSPLLIQQSFQLLTYSNFIVVMYSKYLEYTEAANQAHLAAMDDNRHKDLLIGQLKSQCHELRHLETEFAKLNGIIGALEDKYSLLLAEKERCEKDHRAKAELDKNNIIGLREEIDSLRVQLQKANLQIEDFLRDNTNMKRLCDGRATEVQTVRYQIKESEGKNERLHDQNRGLSQGLRNLKEDRKRLEDQCDALSANLDTIIAKLKNLEKEVRQSESVTAKLEKTLFQAENDNKKLLAEIKQRGECCKSTENKFKGVQNALKETNISLKNTQQQADKNKNELDRHFIQLETETAKGKELQANLVAIESQVRGQESELDEIILDQEQLRRQHFASLDKNKRLNLQIDSVLALIAEYQMVNKELLDEIDLMIDQDEQAKTILSRKETMRELIEGSLRKIASTEEPIRHLKS